MKNWQGIWVFIEQDDGSIEESTLGLISKARELADKTGQTVTAILFGYKIKNKAKILGKYGAHKAIVVENEVLRYYNSDAYLKILSTLINERRPDTILFNATDCGKDLAGGIAVKYKTGLIAHVISLDYDDEMALVGKVPGFGGNIYAIVKCVRGRPQLATVTPGIFEAKEYNEIVDIEVRDVDIKALDIRIKVIKRETTPLIDISKSDKVIVVGRGMAEHIDAINDVAKVINAELGVTRPLVDLGIASRDILVGSSGVILKGKLAIVVGVSGAPHFVSGIRDVDTVIAINNDPEAPIFNYADYNVIEDGVKVFSELKKLINKHEGSE